MYGRVCTADVYCYLICNFNINSVNNFLYKQLSCSKLKKNIEELRFLNREECKFLSVH